MLFLGNPCSNANIESAMSRGLIGMMDTPLQGNPRPPGTLWAADNGCFSDVWDETRWWAWLNAQEDRRTCLFAVAPDVVGDAAATLERSRPWLPAIHELGFPVAYVAQDGQESLPIPEGIDCLFLGGSTAWKLGPAARALVAQARELGLWVHMGRVNTRKRLTYARTIGCHSVDGTTFTRAPDTNLATMVAWLAALESTPELDLLMAR